MPTTGQITMRTWMAVALYALIADVVAAYGPESSLNVSNTTESEASTLHTVTNVLSDAENLKGLRDFVAVCAIVLGVLVASAGYRLFTPTVFVCGFCAGGLLAARVAEGAMGSAPAVVAVSWTTFIISGLVAGSIAAVIATVGILVAIVAGSILLAFIVTAAVGSSVYPSNPNQLLGVLAVCFAVVGALLAWKVEKPLLVTTTSLVGAGMITWGVGCFAGRFPTGQAMDTFRAELSQKSWLSAVPAAWWGYFAAFLILAMLGVAVQYGKTSRGQNFQRTGRSIKLQRDDDYRDLHAYPRRHWWSRPKLVGRGVRRPLPGGLV